MSDNMTTADKEQSFMNEIEQPEIQNWVKGIFAQNITRKTLCEVIKRKWKTYISELTKEEVEHIEIFTKCLEKSKITIFKTELKALKCGHDICEILLTRLLGLRNFSSEPLVTKDFQTREDEIHKMHEVYKDKPIEKAETEAVTDWQNIFSTDSVVLYWPLAKLYASTENVPRSSLMELDTVNVVELLERCTLFSFCGSQKVFKDICHSSNAWLQSSSNKASKEDTDALLQSSVNLLKNFEDSNFYLCSDAIADLQQLMTTDLCKEYKGTEYIHLVKMTLEMKVTALTIDISIGRNADAENVSLDALLKDTNDLLQLVEELISEEESDEVTKLKSENESLKSEVIRLQRETELLKKQGCPGKPEATEVEMESVTLTWDQSSDLRDTDYYQIHYKEETDCEWSIHPEKHRSTTAVLANLKPGATYIFRIKIVGDTECVYSPESDAIVMLHSQAAHLVEEAERLEDFSFAVYSLPLTIIMQNDETKIIKYLIGAGSSNVETKTIIICGSKGTGRSAVVDGIVNYALGVRWNDFFRFTVENEKHFWKKAPREEWITCYTLNPEKGNRLTYQLQVIVIPGFSDASCVSEDENVIRQIRQLLVEMSAENDLCIAAACLVVEATLVSLTDQQRYTLQLILSLFGKDLRTNICTFLISVDNRFSVDSTALTETAFGRCFLFKPLSSFRRCMALQQFWSIFVNTLRGFLGFIEQVPPCTLQLTLTILNERISVMEVNRKLQSKIESVSTQVQGLEADIRQKQEYEIEMKQYEDYEYEETEIEVIKEALPAGRKDVTSCPTCSYTCHDGCVVPENKQECSAMDEDGLCQVCPNKCHWSRHINTSYIFKNIEVQRKKIDPEKQRRYLSAERQFLSQQKEVEASKRCLRLLIDQLDAKITVFKMTIQTINEKSLQEEPKMEFVGSKTQTLKKFEELKKKSENNFEKKCTII